VPLVVGWPPGALLEVLGLLALGMVLGRVPRTPAPSTQLRAGSVALALAPLAWWLAPAWARLAGPALIP
jgi:membrane protein DedA with SNARE-associated domain